MAQTKTNTFTTQETRGTPRRNIHLEKKQTILCVFRIFAHVAYNLPVYFKTN